MTKFLKPGKVVIVTSGRFAGKKGIVLANSEGNKEKKYGHSLVVGINRPPRSVHKKMSKKKVQYRSQIRTFVKTFNHKHFMPTRYNVDMKAELKGKVTAKVEDRKSSEKNANGVLQERFNCGKNRWLFQRLRF